MKAVSTLANTGIYIFEPEIFDYIPADTFYDFGKQVFPELIQNNIKIAGFIDEAEYLESSIREGQEINSRYELLTGEN